MEWSPEQISGWLKTQYPHDESMRVSHETIYRSLFIQARGALKKELVGHLRSKRRIRPTGRIDSLAFNWLNGRPMESRVEKISVVERVPKCFRFWGRALTRKLTVCARA